MSNSVNIPVGTEPRRGASLKMSTVGMAVMGAVLLVAIVFAANQNDVIGWLVVIISGGWLALFAFIVFGVRKAAMSANAKIQEAQARFAGMSGEPASESSVMREEKLAHSFKIVQVQGRVIREELAKGDGGDADVVARAIETIEITAHNGIDMVRKSKSPKTTVEGEVID